MYTEWYTREGNIGRNDPAFDAHVLPLERLATAWWENWKLRVRHNRCNLCQRTHKEGLQKTCQSQLPAAVVASLDVGERCACCNWAATQMTLPSRMSDLGTLDMTCDRVLLDAALLEI